MQINQFITRSVDALNAASTARTSTPRLDVELLLCHALKCSRTWLLTWSDHTLPTQQLHTANQLIQRRLSGEPVAYIIGEKSFWSLSLKVNPSTLIPRPDTERLVEATLSLLVSNAQVLDLGTGTGAIALALAKEQPDWHITGVDIQANAVALAKENALRNHVKNVTFQQGHWFSTVKQHTFDIIVSNPPYIEENDPHLLQGDVRFEPVSALTSGKDGLDDIRHISQQAAQHLAPDGWLLFEHGFQQGSAVRTLLKQQGFGNVTTLQDLSGLDRVTQGRLLS